MKYLAFDGTVFENMNACKDYESSKNTCDMFDCAFNKVSDPDLCTYLYVKNEEQIDALLTALKNSNYRVSLGIDEYVDTIYEWDVYKCMWVNITEQLKYCKDIIKNVKERINVCN